MGPRVDSVPSDQALPTRVDVFVIGGGIIGPSTALFLAQKGVSVALCEKGHIAHEQSSRNWGWCRKMARDPRELPLAIESLRIWEGMNEMVEAETGFRSCGIIYLAETQADLARFEDWLDHARQYQLDSRIIGSAEIARRLPGIGKEFAGALFTASDGKAEPQMAAPAIARAARRHGATILTSCAVRGIETAAGHVVSVVTERSRIACDSVVLAGGAWSRLFCGNLGIELPQLSVLSSVMRTERLDSGPEISGRHARQQGAADAQVDVGTVLFRDKCIGRLLYPIVQEFVGAVLAKDEASADGFPESRVHRLLCQSVNQSEGGGRGDIAQASELLQGFLGGGSKPLQPGGHKVHHVIGVALGAYAIDVPLPSPRRWVEHEQSLFGQRGEELDREERISAGLLVHQLRHV